MANLSDLHFPETLNSILDSFMKKWEVYRLHKLIFHSG